MFNSTKRQILLLVDINGYYEEIIGDDYPLFQFIS